MILRKKVGLEVEEKKAPVVDDRAEEFVGSIWNKPTDPNCPYKGGWTRRKSWEEVWIPQGFMFLALIIAVLMVLLG